MSTEPDEGGTQAPGVQTGAWIFVSHSHKDLDEVRRIRNALEAKGHNPILFFLKCLGDDGELAELIQREIRARKFFLLCESSNSRTSRYVQEEIRFIRGLPDKIYVTVDLNSAWQEQLNAVDALSRDATVYLAYARESSALARALYDELAARDYKVWLDMASVVAGKTWVEQIDDAMQDAINEDGLFLLILSPDALTKEFVLQEMRGAMTLCNTAGRSSKLVPIIASQRELTRTLLRQSELAALSLGQAVDFTTGTFEANLDRLLGVLRTRAME